MMIVVKVSKEDNDTFKKCASFVAKNAKRSFGEDFKILANSDTFTVISDNDSKSEDGIQAQLIIKKTINLTEENESSFYRKLEFFIKNANKIMDKIVDAD
jgi:hypothetical protein